MRADDVLTPDAVEFLDRPRSASSATGARELLARRAERLARLAARRAAGLPPETARRPRGRLADRAVPRRDRRPPRRDHRPGRPQDGDQRAQLGRAGLHGRLRGRELARPGRTASRASGTSRTRSSARSRSTPARSSYALERRGRGAVRAAARLASRGAPLRGRRRADVRRRCSTSASTSSATTARNGRYFYLPKLESHLEARLWNDVFACAQERLGVPRGTIKATVLIETILAAFEMDEILYELREHSAGLNAGRWDYIFSVIKKLGHRPEFVLPDRAAVTMAVPFMRAYCELLVKTCHRRGAHAMGGMAAFIPSRRDAEVNAVALAKVREDKEREASQGFDGTWVAHPDLVPVALRGVRRRARRPARTRSTGSATTSTSRAADLLDVAATPGEVTEDGPAQQRLGRDPVPRRLAARLRRGGDQQPDGGRGDRRDLAARRSGSGSTTAAFTRRRRRAAITDEEMAKLGAGYDEARAIFERIATRARLRRVPHAARRTTGSSRQQAEADQPCSQASPAASTTSSRGATSWRLPIASAGPAEQVDPAQERRERQPHLELVASSGRPVDRDARRDVEVDLRDELAPGDRRTVALRTASGSTRWAALELRADGAPYSSARLGNVARVRARGLMVEDAATCRAGGPGPSPRRRGRRATRVASPTARPRRSSPCRARRARSGARRRSPTVSPASRAPGRAERRAPTRESRRPPPMRAMGPTVSKEGQSGNTPSSGTRPQRGFSPTISHAAAGSRIEQPVSVPIPRSQRPAASAAAFPLDEPPVVLPGRRGLCTVPYHGFWLMHAPGELGRFALPTSDRACGESALDDDCVPLGHVVGVDLRAVRRADARRCRSGP